MKNEDAIIVSESSFSMVCNEKTIGESEQFDQSFTISEYSSYVFIPFLDHLSSISFSSSGSHTLPRSLMSAHPTKSSPLLAMTNSTLNLISSENHSKPSGSTISLLHDYKSICSCFGNTHGSISASEIGFARAFVRLALERRLLSRHLSELFSQTDLLQALYKRDSFLRADDGDLRKQFLAHVESLQLLDYHCFSNSYADIDIIYHVTIVPTRTRATGIASTTTANPYVALSGLLGSTKVISLPSKNSLEMKIKVVGKKIDDGWIELAFRFTPFSTKIWVN